MVLAAVGQLTASANLAFNGQAAGRLIKAAAAKGAKVLFLPEASDYIGSSPQETVSLAKPVNESPFIREVRNALAASPIYVSVGVHEPTDPPSERVRNTLLWLSPSGEVLNRYQKIHLFDADVPNGPILRESKSVEPGPLEGEPPFESPVGVLGPAICYDIRFPEMAHGLTRKGAEVLLFPSAFTVKTGEAHWHALNRARAIDNQCFVISAAQAGKHDQEGKRQSYGHSVVVDPWGTIIAEAKTDGEELVLVDLDLSQLGTVRGNMPLMKQREALEKLK